MPAAYQINDLERLTGIKAHTIRIWEKRYKLIEPHRTATNIRYYDDEQARKLLNVATLLDNGYKISRVAAMNEEQMAECIRVIREQPGDDAVIQSFVNDLTASMLVYNEAAFEKSLGAALTRYGMFDCVMRVLYPFLEKVGMLWSISQAMPAQEHFASSLVRKKLMAACDGLPPAEKSDKKFVLFLPPDEWHDIGLVFTDYLIRSKGYPVIFLGQNVPYENLSEVIEKVKPTHAVGFFITGRPYAEISDFVRNFTHKHPKVHLLIGGYAALQGKAFSSAKVDRLHQPADLLEQLGA